MRPESLKEIEEMLTDEDFAALKTMFASLLEDYGLKKPLSSAALRMQRYRERHRNESVTDCPTKRNGASRKRNAHITVNPEFLFEGITSADMARWQEAFPALAIPDEIDRAALWLKANPRNKKSNYERFLVNWFTRNQERAPRA